jgi:catechol 2,3-dioxygenase-like lactoylglutathione lyase family enzyme
MSAPTTSLDVVALRPFVPARDFETSVRFYEELGFSVRRITDGLAEIKLGVFSFLLQAFVAEGYADNFMMQMLVNDLAAWWTKIKALDLATKYGVRPPKAPAMQPWGLTVAYVVDPGGILWHFVQKPA